MEYQAAISGSQTQLRKETVMLKAHRFCCRVASILLAVLLLVEPLAVWAEETNEAPVTHIAKSTVALKVRRAPSKSSTGSDSIPRGSYVYIIEYGDMWCRVRTDRTEGYILTQYLTDIIAQTDVPQKAEEEEKPAGPTGELMPGFTTNESNFRQGYQAHALNVANIYAEPNVSSRIEATVPTYNQVIVSEVSGDWSLVCYKGRHYGYMLNSSLFKWDRIDPYAGEIPGLDIWPYLAFVNKSVTLYDLKTNEELVTVNPGSAICVGEPDEFGRYPLPYHRTTSYLKEEDIAWKIPTANWQDAQSGDLLSVMTTFYPVGVSTLQYQGRCWNIRLASTRITGSILQPGQDYNQYKVIGPYKKSTGYKEAPIMSDDALTGFGGGTCQVNTTFYIATVQLPLLVTHRKVHANVGMYYAQQGFDAAVGGGDINLTMVNTLPYAIRYQMFLSDGVLTCCIFRV